MRGQGQIIGSSINQVPYMLAVNRSGAVPVAAYSGGTIYPLLVDSSGKLETTASIGTVTTGSEAYMWGQSGGTFYRVLTDTEGKLVTTASVTVDSVFIASGADIGSVYLKDGAFVNVIASGTTGLPISGVVTTNVDSVFIASGADIGSVYLKDGATVAVTGIATAGSLAVQTIIGSMALTTTPLQISGNVTISDDNYLYISSSGTTGLPVSGAVTVNSTNLDIRDLTSSSDSIEVIQDTQADLKSTVYQGTDPWVILGSTQITNSTIEISGNVTISDDNYINIIASGTTGIPISGVVTTNVDSVFIASGADIGSVYLKDGATVSITNASTIGSLAIQTVDGTISVNINNESTIGSYTTQTVDGIVNVTDIATAGSLAIQSIAGSIAITSSTTLQVSGNVTITNDNYINIASSGTTGLPVSGAVTTGSQVWVQELGPIDSSFLNCKTTLIYSGTVIGSIIKFTSTGSYVKALSYTGNNLTGIGSWI